MPDLVIQQSSNLSSKDVERLVNRYLKNLKKDRDRLVLKRRHGLIDEIISTLESIGKDLGITRERVRQIEKNAIEKVIKLDSHQHELNEKILELLVEYGGLISFETLLAELKLSTKDRNNLMFLVKANPGFLFIDKTDVFECMLVNGSVYCAEDIIKLHDELVDLFNKNSKPIKFEKIYQSLVSNHHLKAAQEVARASKLITELDKLWGLNNWSEINPRSIKDKIYFVLKKSSRPMHFSEITRSINAIDPKKKVTRQAVHNVLIKDSRFVLIGRGIYALSEWGYQPGTVSEIIADILRSESPLSRQDIVQRVLARRQVKIATILLNLQDKRKFKKISKGVYALVEN